MDIIMIYHPHRRHHHLHFPYLPTYLPTGGEAYVTNLGREDAAADDDDDDDGQP